MSIANKLTWIAENIPTVYEAGQQSMVDESKIIEKTVSGSVISLDDVSEVPHEVGVQLSSDTVTDFSGVAVNVIGENLFDAKKYPLIVGREIWATDGSMTYGGGTTICGTEVYIPCNLLRGKTITILHTTSIGGLKGVAFYDDNKTYISGVKNNNGSKITATIPDNATYYRFSMDAAYIDVAQIYETNNKKTYTANADGTLTIKSASPNMYITAETDGINITATYHKSWGMQTEYDRFWDAYQNNGNVVEGYGMFSGNQWTDETYQPKHPIKVSLGTQLFRNARITDIVVPVDISGAVGNMYFNSCINLVTIPKLIVNEDTTFLTAFAFCTNLKEIRFEGTIGKSLDIHWSTKLSAESYENIFKCMTVTVSGQTLTVPKSTAEATYNAKYGSGKWASRVNGIKALGWAVSYL